MLQGDLLAQVLRFLSFPELLRARAVSSLLREAASENGCVEVGHEHNRKETLQLLPRLFPRLTDVRISGFPNHRSRFDDHLATVLAEAAPCLTRLALPWSVRLTDVGLEALANISTLQNIDFEGCSKLTDVGLAEIAKRCQGLHHLRIAGCRAVGGHCLRSLQPNLRSLDLRDCSKLHEGLLAKLLSQLPVLRELYLSRLVQVSDAVLFAAARHCPQLEVLELEGCSKVSDIGLEAVTRRCRGLQSLNLNACGRVSSGLIAKLSRQCPRLIHLHLSTLNGAVDDHALGGLVRDGSRLRKLSISGCHASVDKLKELASVCKQLEALDLSGTIQCDDDVVQELRQGCPRLAQLNTARCWRLSDT